MRLYVAGKFEDHDECRMIMDRLEEQGHIITCDWTNHEYSDKAYPTKYCQDDIKGVQDCDCLIFNAFNERKYSGALVEMGIALGLDKPVLILGHGIDTCIFTHSPLVKKFDNMKDLLEALCRPL